jgi:small subunit ribosomal protein S4
MVKNLKKQYETPNRAWNEERIQREDQLREEYGLKNKEEIYKAYSQLRTFRRQARKLVGEDDEKQKEQILNKANRLGLIKSDAEMTDLLTLKVEDILNRRLQTAVDRRGHSDTSKHARQLVTHGRVKVGGKKVNIPGYMLTQEEEKTIEVKEPAEPSEAEEVEDSEEATGEASETEENEEEVEE